MNFHLTVRVESTEASNVGSKQSGLTSGQNAVNETRSESPEVTKKSPEDEHLSSKDSHDINPGMSPLADSDGGKGSAEASTSRSHSSNFSKTPSKKTSSPLY